MAKKVIERIFKTMMIVVDILYGAFMLVYSVACLFMTSYTLNESLLQTFVSVVAMVVVNVISVLIRRWIRNY